MSGGGRCNVAAFRPRAQALRHRVLAEHAEEAPPLLAAPRAAPVLRGGDGHPASSWRRRRGSSFPYPTAPGTCGTGLDAMARRDGVETRFGVTVTGLAPEQDGWTVVRGERFHDPRPSVILCSGGLSVPATGSDGKGLTSSRGLGHTVHETYPAADAAHRRAAPLRGAHGRLASRHDRSARREAAPGHPRRVPLHPQGVQRLRSSTCRTAPCSPGARAVEAEAPRALDRLGR